MAPREDQDATAERILELTRERHALVAQIAAKETKSAEEAREKADLAAITTSELKNQLAIESQRAEGNDAAVARMEAELEIDREIQTLREKGVTDETLLDKLAASRRQQVEDRLSAEKEAAALRSEELALSTAIKEAEATGNKAEVEKLNWLKEYNALLRDGASEDQARRAANASSALANKSATTDTDPITRRDAITTRSAADIAQFPRPLDITESRLDNPTRNFSTGFQDFLAGRPDAPTPSGSSQPSGAGGAQLSQAATKQESSAAELDSAATAVTSAASAIESAATAIASSHKALASRMSKVESQIKSISKDT